MKVTITVLDSMVLIDPWIPFLKSSLSCIRTGTKMVEIENDDGTVSEKVVETNTRELLYGAVEDDNGKQVGMTWPGMVPVLKKALEAQRYTYELIDEQTPVPEPDMSRLDLPNPRKGQIEMLALMCSERHAILEAPTGYGKTVLISQFCRLYPESNILVTTKKKTVQGELHRRLEASDPDRVVHQVTSGQELDENASIWVAADKSLHRIPEDWPDIVVYDEAHNAGAAQACSQLKRFAHCRTYGMSATPEGRTDKTDLQTQAMLGPVRMRIPYQVAQKEKAVAPMQVLMYHLTLPPRNITSKYVKTNICIVRNTARNQIIAQVTRSIVPADEQVLIMVGTTEHALRLKKHFPGVTALYKKISAERASWLSERDLLTSDDPVNPDIEQGRKDFLDGKIKRMITTKIWQEGIDFPHLKYLVRADGLATSIGTIQMGGRATRYEEGRIGTIISFVDYYDNLQYRGFNQIKEYEKRGWTVHRMSSLPDEPKW